MSKESETLFFEGSSALLSASSVPWSCPGTNTLSKPFFSATETPFFVGSKASMKESGKGQHITVATEVKMSKLAESMESLRKTIICNELKGVLVVCLIDWN